MSRAIRVLVLYSPGGQNRPATYYPEREMWDAAKMPDSDLLLWARGAFEGEADEMLAKCPALPRPTFLRAEVSR